MLVRSDKVGEAEIEYRKVSTVPFSITREIFKHLECKRINN